MQRALGIVAAVTGCVVVEILLLLSVIVPDQFYEHQVYRTFVSWSQFVLIPGFAALFSRFIYGPQKWGRRMLVTLLFAPLGLCIFIIPFFVIATLQDWTFIVSKILFAAAMSVIFGAMVMAFRWCLRRLRMWSAESEAERWLAERQSGTSAHDRRWRTRGIRMAVCIPVLLTLPIFLFLPETWGLASHVRWPRGGVLAGYKVRVPATWYIFCHYSGADGRSYVNGIAGRGIGFGGNPFHPDSLSWWSIGTKSVDENERTDYDFWPPKPGDIFGQREVKIGGGTLTCVDYLPSYGGWVPPRSQTATIAHIDCSGVGRLHANFEGPRYQLKAFYRVLDGITEVK